MLESDSRALPDARPHVNSGFLLLPGGLDWDEALASSRHLIADPEWFTEQTVVHRAIHHNGAALLPPHEYVLSWEDRHLHTDVANEADVVVRHYVTPVRHKYWVMVHGGYSRSVRAVARHLLRAGDRGCDTTRRSLTRG